MENWRSFQEGEQAYQKYLDMTQDEKERDAASRDGKSPEESPEEPDQKDGKENGDSEKEEKVERPEKGDAVEYTTRKGKKTSVVVVDPEHDKSGEVIARQINPEDCKQKGSNFAAGSPEVFAQKTGEPIEQCAAGSGGESQIAKLISQKLEDTGLDDYIKKITKRQDLYELEKVILNLALDSSSPIKSDDLLKVVIQLKKDIEGKMKAAKGVK